jgi:DNA-binding transcriptional LysR family regulator
MMEWRGNKVQRMVFTMLMNHTNNVEIRHLRHFVAVAEAGSYTAAASEVHLTQSALSVSIRSLERELGVPVFVRTTHRVRLSEAGAELLPRAKDIIRAMSDTVDGVRGADGVIRGTLRVGIMHSLSLIDGANIFREFHRRYPEVVIQPRANAQGAAALIDQVRTDDLDVAFVWLDADPGQGLRSETLARDSFVLVEPENEFGSTSDDEAQLADLADEMFVELPAGWVTRTAIDRAFALAGVHRRVVAEVADVALCIDLVRAGLGVIILPRSYLGDTRGVRLRSLPEVPDWAMSMLTPAGEPRAAAAAFAELVRSWHSPR